MFKADYLKIIQQGVKEWNEWRHAQPEIVNPDLSDIDFTRSDLRYGNFKGANLSGSTFRSTWCQYANFSGACLINAKMIESEFFECNFSNADLHGANMSKSIFYDANFEQANLQEVGLCDARLSGGIFTLANLNDSFLCRAHFNNANLRGAYLNCTNLIETQFTGADLQYAQLTNSICTRTNFENASMNFSNLANTVFVDSNFQNADISNSSVYGASVWDVNLTNTKQNDLVITKGYDAAINRLLSRKIDTRPLVLVSSFEVAQFIYLLIDNSKIREIIDTVAQKAILLLGRFSEERMVVLKSLAEALTKKGFIPIIFDFKRSDERDVTETIKTLASLSLFIISDISSPNSNPLELQAIVPDFMIPVVPIIKHGEIPFSMFVDLQNKYQWILPLIEYENVDDIIKVIDDAIIYPALTMHNKLIIQKAKSIKKINIKSFLSPNSSGN